MEKRLGVIAILLTRNEPVTKLNLLLSDFSDMILARQGLPLREKDINVISLVVEGSTDRIGALTGKIGRLEGCKVKSVLTDFREDTDEYRNAPQDFG
jgi:putative iron-only hydrogenase system regulator